jgi:hypothetical protein
MADLFTQGYVNSADRRNTPFFPAVAESGFLSLMLVAALFSVLLVMPAYAGPVYTYQQTESISLPAIGPSPVFQVLPSQRLEFDRFDTSVDLPASDPICLIDPSHPACTPIPAGGTLVGVDIQMQLRGDYLCALNPSSTTCLGSPNYGPSESEFRIRNRSLSGTTPIEPFTHTLTRATGTTFLPTFSLTVTGGLDDFIIQPSTDPFCVFDPTNPFCILKTTSIVAEMLSGYLGGDFRHAPIAPYTWQGRVSVTYAIEGADAVVPEPTTLALMGLGLAGVGFSRRRKWL